MSQKEEASAYVACVNKKLGELIALNALLTDRLKTLVEQTTASQTATDASIKQLRASKLIARVAQHCEGGEIYQYALCLSGGKLDSNAGNFFCFGGQGPATVICKVPQ